MVHDPRNGSSIEDCKIGGVFGELGRDGSTEDGMMFRRSEEEDDGGGDGGFDVFLLLLIVLLLI